MDGLELKLSPTLQDALRTRALEHERSVEEEARALLEAALEPIVVPGEPQLEQLAVLGDEQLWQVARQQVSEDRSERMQELTERLKAEGLSPEASEEVRRLQAYARRVMLLRAEASALLKRRGYDVRDVRVQL